MGVNPFGLAMMAVILIPNIIFAIRCRDGFENLWHHRLAEGLEQAGRYGCMAFMAVRGPRFGFSSDEAFALYLLVGCALVLAYCAVWLICFRKNSLFRALALSILPSVLFLFCGVMSHSILLTLSALIFAPSHITISYQNAVRARKE